MSVCLIIAAILFFLAAIGVVKESRYDLIAAGLFFMVVAQLGGVGFHIG